MLYQTLLSGLHPYMASIIPMVGFEEHRHSEIELVYCISGSCDIGVNKNLYRIHAGDLAIIGSMLPHMTLENPDSDCLTLTVMAGPVLLLEYFEPLSKAVFHDPVFHLTETQANNRPLIQLLDEIVELAQNETDFSQLIIRGNLYKVFAHILKHFAAERIDEQDRKALRDVAKIEQALDLIHAKYTEQLTVDLVAKETGYGKSNFCKIFKQITGSTFHAALNQHRLENACLLLQNTTLPIEAIAQQVGFTDAKSLCRVFKTIYGTTPGSYRKEAV